MLAVPGELATDNQPPLTVPLRHFLVGLGFLVGAAFVGTWVALRSSVTWLGIAHVHLLLVGWIAITIMGAMTQFVPVWSGKTLYSERLALAQLWLVTVGLIGFIGTLLAGRPDVLFVPGALMVSGFWLFVYNLSRTIHRVGPYDVTERHFLFALASFVLLTVLGFGLTIDLAVPVLRPLGLRRPNVIGAHATLAVYGALSGTLIGAIYQLGPMFTQTELSRLERRVQSIEDLLYPIGVLSMAGGRLVGHRYLATIGAMLVAGSVFAVGLVLTRRLIASRVPWSPMLVRYAVAAPAMLVWALLAVPAWIARPLARATLFGSPGSRSLFVFGVLGFVVMGTLYHVVPFVVWLHRYSDQIGFEPVPMIDDLYNERVATVDFVAVTVGAGGIVLVGLLELPRALAVVSAAFANVGFGLFAGNLLLVVRNHSPEPLRRVLFGNPHGSTLVDG